MQAKHVLAHSWPPKQLSGPCTVRKLAGLLGPALNGDKSDSQCHVEQWNTVASAARKQVENVFVLMLGS